MLVLLAKWFDEHLCWLGFHDWVYSYNDPARKGPGQPQKVCACCGRFEWM